MATEYLKSSYLAGLDATPIVMPTTGEGAQGFLRSVSGTVTATTGELLGSTYQLVRFPTNSVIRHVYIGLDATVSTFTADIGLYYSTSTNDGTSAANRGLPVNSTTGSQLFGAGVSALNTIGDVDYANAMGGAKRNMPIWQAAGLTKDPGGNFDLVLTTTATNSGAPVISAEVQFVI
jgi:hypothetical protein